MADPFDTAGPTLGPWFEARYDGDCDSCGDDFYEGDLIRATGSGGYDGQDCCGDD